MAETKSKNDPRTDIARENLRMAAAKRGMTLSEIGLKAGMSRNGLQQFTSGRTSISYANMLRVCDALGVPIGILHRRDAITDSKIRLYQALDVLPDHLAAEALGIAQATLHQAQ